MYYSCKQEKETKKVEIEPDKHTIWLMEHDTILEKNNPISLDLSKHQLFIDTTRNSQFYDRVINFKPTQMDSNALSYYKDEISKKYKLNKIDLKSFPKRWTTLKKLNDKFVIYDPCNGQTPSYEINENSVYFFHQIEPDADLIFRLKKLNQNEIELELRTITLKSKTEKAELSIKPTQIKNVFELTYNLGDIIIKEFVTPNNKVSEFDLIVNHSPKAMRMEFKGFDKE